ncbi:MAG: hypothetical protein ACTSYB_14615, partial [Candidatus Helarchaeota archaeon]
MIQFGTTTKPWVELPKKPKKKFKRPLKKDYKNQPEEFKKALKEYRKDKKEFDKENEKYKKKKTNEILKGFNKAYEFSKKNRWIFELDSQHIKDFVNNINEIKLKPYC